MKMTFCAGLAIVFLTTSAWAQFIDDHAAAKRSPETAQVVEFLFPAQVNLPAHKATKVVLHFRVAQGLHVNSHRPHDEFLIPTNFSIPEGKGVRMVSAVYSEGVEAVLPADPRMKLNVYTGAFEITAMLESEPGNHLIEGKLRYQACDLRQCMPPKTIPVAIDVIGK